MRFIRAVKGFVLLIAILLVNSVSLISHASAMPTMSHVMSGMNHSASDSTSCATQCRTAVFSQEEKVPIESASDDADDESSLPFCAHTVGWKARNKTSKERLYAAVVKPPPKVQIYIRYGVSRT